MEQKLYQSVAYPFYVELQEVMRVTSGRLPYRPVKFTVFMPFYAIFCHSLLIMPVYSGSKSIENRNEERGNRIKG
jgi:hypothetical protein